MSTTLISSLLWIPRGKSAPHPKTYDLDEKELERVGKMGGEGMLEKLREEMERMEVGNGNGEGGADGEGEWEDDSDGSSASGSSSKADAADGMEVDGEATKPPPKVDDPNDLSAYNLDTYDEEEGGGIALGAFSSIKGLQAFQDNNDDPYITLKEDPEEQNQEREDLEILPTDSILLTARTSSDLSSLDLHVYDEGEDNLFVRNDLLITSLPLCIEWLDFPPALGEGEGAGAGAGGRGSYVAVGTMDPMIEIWDMDMVDSIYPSALLGPSPTEAEASNAAAKSASKAGGKKKKSKPLAVSLPKFNDSHHTSAVTSLSWSPFHRNLLLSGSADSTIKLWDLTHSSPSSAVRSWRDIHPNGEKVLGVQWNKTDVGGTGENKTVVLSAGERTVCVWDTRAAESNKVGTGVLGKDVECIRWDPWTGMDFFVSLENGLILAYDARTLSSSASTSNKSKSFSETPQPKYTIQAHDGAASAMDVNPHIKGCLATGGQDGKVKVWNVSEEDGGKRDVSLAVSRDLGVGKVFTLGFSPDSPLTLAAAGSLAKVQIWDIGANTSARKVFGNKLREAGKTLRERQAGHGGVIGLADEDEEGESDEE